MVSSNPMQETKERGNEEYAKGNWDRALGFYTKALELSPENNADKAILYKNRAAVYLKKGSWGKAIGDCDKALKICPKDVKALFRRCHALESLGQFSKALQDIYAIVKVDQSNEVVGPMINRLDKIIDKQYSQNYLLSSKLRAAFQTAFNFNCERKCRAASMNELLVLSRGHSCSEVMIKFGILSRLLNVFIMEKNEDQIIVPALGILEELVKKKSDETDYVIFELSCDHRWFFELLTSNNKKVVAATMRTMETVMGDHCGKDDEPDTKIQELKKQGNEAFGKGNWNKALKLYTEALELSSEENSEKAILHKNRAAVYLKKNDYIKAIQDCNVALKISPSDPKALFRRCQALEALGRYGEAYKDARIIIDADPSNKTIRPIYARLLKSLRGHQQSFLPRARFARKLEDAFNVNIGRKRRAEFMKELLVLTKDEASSEVFQEEDTVQKLLTLCIREKDHHDIVTPALEIMKEFCKNEYEKACTVGLMFVTNGFWLDAMLSSNDKNVVEASKDFFEDLMTSWPEPLRA